MLCSFTTLTNYFLRAGGGATGELSNEDGSFSAMDAMNVLPLIMLVVATTILRPVVACH